MASAAISAAAAPTWVFARRPYKPPRQCRRKEEPRMADTPNYAWPPMKDRKFIGKSPKRLDGPAKSTGRAKYSSDTNPKGLLFGVYLVSPHAHAKVTSIDTSPAEKSPGVKS